MIMKKKLIAAAVVASIAGFAGQAAAGTASATYNTYATEALSTLLTIAAPSMAYQTNVVLAANTTVTMYVKLDNGGKFVSDNAVGGLNEYQLADVTLAGATTNAVSYSADATTLIVEFGIGGAAIATGALINFTDAAAAAGDVPSLNLSGSAAALSSGGQVTASFAMVNGPAGVLFPASGVIDSSSGIIANASEGISGTFQSSADFSGAVFVTTDGAADETQKIDVGTQNIAMTAGANTASTTIVNLGGFYISDVAGTQLAAGGGDIATGADVDEIQFTVNGSFIDDDASTLTPAAAVWIDDAPSCAGVAQALTWNATTGVYSAAAGDVAIAGADATYYVCYGPNMNAAVGTELEILETTPSLSGITLVNSGAPTVALKTFANATLYPLTLNGSTVTLINYVPAAAAPYQTWARIANTGQVAATVTVTFIGEDGVAIGSGDLATVIPVGGAGTFSPATLEAAAGVSLAAGDRPILRFYGTTDVMAAQAYMQDANGGYTNLTFDTTK